MKSNDPHGKRALFESPPTTPSPHTSSGREALYSVATPEPRTVVVACSACGEHKRIEVLEAIARVLRATLWVPLLGYSRWMRCPSCEKRAWCRVGWVD